MDHLPMSHQTLQLCLVLALTGRVLFRLLSSLAVCCTPGILPASRHYMLLASEQWRKGRPKSQGQERRARDQDQKFKTSDSRLTILSLLSLNWRIHSNGICYHTRILAAFWVLSSKCQIAYDCYVNYDAIMKFPKKTKSKSLEIKTVTLDFETKAAVFGLKTTYLHRSE